MIRVFKYDMIGTYWFNIGAFNEISKVSISTNIGSTKTSVHFVENCRMESVPSYQHGFFMKNVVRNLHNHYIFTKEYKPKRKG